MKKLLVLITGLLLINYSSNSSSFMTAGTAADSLVVLSTPGLGGLVRQWATEFNKSQPRVMISVETVSEEGMAGRLSGGQIGFIRGADASAGGWKMVIARDVIVPVINRNNPFITQLAEKGISPARLSEALGASVPLSWGALLGNDSEQQASVYYLDQLPVTGQLERIAENRPNARGFATTGELVAAIEKEPGCIAFCRLCDIAGHGLSTLPGNIAFLPVDRNGNGMLDYNEKIYDDLSSLERGVWIGKYPKTFYQNVVAVSGSSTIPEQYMPFIGWVIGAGQEFLGASGFTGLLSGERQKNADILAGAKLTSGADAINEKSIFRSLLFIIAGLVIAFTAINLLIKTFRKKPSLLQKTGGVHPLNEKSLILPKGILFDKTHSWAFMEQNGLVKIGIDDFLQHVTGTISRIKMKNPGDKIRKGEEILTIVQNGKQLKIYSPLTGIIRERNESLERHASVINTSPYNEGWVYRMEPYNWTGEMQMLQMADRQRQYINEEMSRMKDFLVSLVNSDKMNYAPVILQDGGMMVDNTLENMGPEVWEEFQMRFLDSSRQVWFYEIM